ncbi:MAG: hypothetical protein GC159_11955 [Phycisphaera sp.]|nr:hypothetical protein [Phycisphaera sp.]
MSQARIARIWTGVALLCALCAAATPVLAQPKPESELDRMRREMQALRAELATAKLELAKTLNELDQVRQFIASKSVNEDISRWKDAREQLEKERNQLSLERRKLIQAKQSLQDAARVGTFEQEQARLDLSPEERAAQPRWELDYKIAVVQGPDQGESIYIDPTGGDVLLERYPNIDRKHIMVRGTLQNTSSAPWRYTFEIRIGDKFGRIIGKWKHQTPLLTTNQLHAFEVKVPITDVGYIHSYQIGNIIADRPGAAAGGADVAQPGAAQPGAAQPGAQPAAPQPQPEPKLRIRPDGRAY